MNIKLNLPIVPGGIFSKFMQMLPNALPYDVERIYFNAHDERIGCNAFNWVMDQYYDETFINVECLNNGSYTKPGSDGLGAIEESKDFDKMKLICSKIKFNIHTGPGCDLGIHVRLTDMNTMHPQYGNHTTKDYIDKILELKPQSIFIASDNHKSISDIIDSYTGVAAYNPFMIREDADSSRTTAVQRNNLNNKAFWVEAFTDMFMLSKSAELLCRVSNLANASILFSNSITKIHRL